MSQTLLGAMAALELPMDAGPVAPGSRRGTAPAAGTDWPARALDLLQTAEDRLREGDWAGYGQTLEELRALLEGLQGDSTGRSQQ
jgi:hypothetical protein